ncbi:ATP-binding protein [Candidatus Cyanaurora vandensis]|uniref:ATP-binding protein n=1 Tax=Candidatus Cyanaurora vandensis TaxID=2714958 RepID=UPI00257CA97C|nr:ATP-binding protein [Candidatus Cyanaurora vandensis]
MSASPTGLASVVLELQKHLERVRRPEEICLYTVRCLGQFLKWRCVISGLPGSNGQVRTIAEYTPSPGEPTLSSLKASEHKIYYLPLTYQETGFGMLTLYSRLKNQDECLSEQDYFLELVAHQVGFALHGAELRIHQKNLEQRIQDLEQTNARQLEFLADVSHELRTPLNTVLGMSKVLMQGSYGEVNPKQKTYLQSIHESGLHSLQLVNNILDVSKINAERVELDIQETDVQAACQQCLSLVEAQVLTKRLTVILNIDERVICILADELRLKQMLLNLLANAVKFTPEDGYIGLTVEPDQSDHGVEYIRFLVWDTGVGIAEEQQKFLFQPFTQVTSSAKLRNQGTGLGLSITWKLAQLHGGRIWVDSALGEGARFSLELPTTPLRNMTIVSDTAEPERRGHVLLVEDYSANAQDLADGLKFVGYEVTWVDNDQDFKTQVMQQSVELVLLGLHRPDQDGLSPIRWLKTQGTLDHLFTIALTDTIAEAEALSAGADRYLTKPVDLTLLLSVLDLYRAS